MLDRSEYMPLQYLVKQKWSGSYQGMRFLLQKKLVMPEPEKEPETEVNSEQLEKMEQPKNTEQPEKSEPEPIPVLEAVCWKEPYSYEATADEKKTYQQFSLSEEGRLEAIEWLEQQYEERKSEWIAAQKWDWEQ